MFKPRYTEVEHKLLDGHAKRRGKTIKEVVRDAIRRMLKEVSPEEPIFSEPPSAPSTGAREGASLRRDAYLYGDGSG